MDIETIKPRCYLLDSDQLFESVLSPVLTVILHSLQFLSNVVIASSLCCIKTLPKVRTSRIDWLMKNNDLSQCSEIAQEFMEVVFTHRWIRR